MSIMVKRSEFVRLALAAGVPLFKIEEYFDYLCSLCGRARCDRIRCEVEVDERE